MKRTLLFSFFYVALAFVYTTAAADVYRCAGVDGRGTEYINNAKEAQIRGCKTMQGGSVTVVQGRAPAAALAPAQKTPLRVATAGNPAAPRIDASPDQKARESDSRSILQSELKKAESKLAEQQKEFNNGEPEKQGIEGRNYQRYLDRVAELKDGITRNQSDIAGLKREIGRLPVTN